MSRPDRTSGRFGSRKSVTSVYSDCFRAVRRSPSMAVKLFVGGLSFSTSNERLREAFAAAGSVESASVVTDRDTGRSRGFGFVEMATPEEAEQAISRLNGTNLDGRTIQVEKAKAPGTGGGDRRGGGGGGRGGFGGGGGGGGRGGSRGGGGRW